MSDKHVTLSLMEQKELERRWALDCLPVPTYQLRQSTSGHLHMSEIRMHLASNEILQLIGRVVVFFPRRYLDNSIPYNQWNLRFNKRW